MNRRGPETPVPVGSQVGFVAWCRGRGRRIDGAARADYVIALLKIADDSG